MFFCAHAVYIHAQDEHNKITKFQPECFIHETIKSMLIYTISLDFGSYNLLQPLTSALHEANFATFLKNGSS